MLFVIFNVLFDVNPQQSDFFEKKESFAYWLVLKGIIEYILGNFSWN